MTENKAAWQQGFEVGYAAAMEELSLENKTSDKMDLIDRQQLLQHFDNCLKTGGFNAYIVAMQCYVEQMPTVEREAESNPYWERVCEIADRQRAKGKDKYGFGLEDNPAEMAARIRHLEEELIDGLMYCEWIKEKLNDR